MRSSIARGFNRFAFPATLALLLTMALPPAATAQAQNKNFLAGTSEIAARIDGVPVRHLRSHVPDLDPATAEPTGGTSKLEGTLDLLVTKPADCRHGHGCSQGGGH
jgi:hypothetical protein